MVIKLSTPWQLNYIEQLLHVNVPGFEFEINNCCTECDIWIIWGGLLNTESVLCSSVLYIADESHEERVYNQEYLNQFNQIATVSDHPYHKNKIHIHELTLWYFKNTEDLFNNTSWEKSKNISIICSDATGLDGHKKRYALVNKLIGHFKDKIDVYGRGFNYIDDKLDALKEYKYSIAIENKSIPNYFSEKLIECFMAYTIPIYAGCTNIDNYFDSSVIFKLDLDDYKKSIILIEKILEEDPYERLKQNLLNNRKLYLDKYHLFPALTSIVNSILNKRSIPVKSLMVVKPESTFTPNFQPLQFSTINEICSELYKRIKSKLF